MGVGCRLVPLGVGDVHPNWIISPRMQPQSSLKLASVSREGLREEAGREQGIEAQAAKEASDKAQ
eukprot:5939369-Amphidinium_carterae.1